MRTMLHNFDTRITTLIQQWPDWVQPIMLFATFIGQPIFTLGTGALIIGLGIGRSNIRLIIAGAMALLTFGVGSLLKLAIHRARPLTEYVENMRLDTFSMPSNHAAGAAVAFGLVAYLLWHVLPQPWNSIVAILMVILIILIGISRIYLGAHYPSDVVAGWLLGLLGLALIIIFVQPKL